MISRRAILGGVLAAAGGTLAVGAEEALAGADQSTNEQPKEAAAPSYKFRLRGARPHEYDGGSIREHRVADFPASHNTAGAIVVLKGGAFREPHWHPNSDEWAYILAGKVRLTVVGAHGLTTVEDFEYGDAWFVPIGFGHSVLNLGEGDAEVLLVHNNGNFTTVELSEWAAGGPKEVFAATLDVPEATLDNVPKKKLFLARKRKK